LTCAAARFILKEVNPFKVGGTTTVRVAPVAGMDGAFSMLREYARKTRIPRAEARPSGVLK